MEPRKIGKMVIKDTRGVNKRGDKRTATDCAKTENKMVLGRASNGQAGECQERIQWRKDVI